MILEYFQESECETDANGECCDVCSILDSDIDECQDELAAILKVVKDFPNKGVKKVCLYIF